MPCEAAGGPSIICRAIGLLFYSATLPVLLTCHRPIRSCKKTHAVTWTLESGSRVHYCGGMSKNSKDDLVSKKNIYTQQILYDRLNLAERTGLTFFFSFWCNPEGSFDARHF